jgi:hypothetical protein
MRGKVSRAVAGVRDLNLARFTIKFIGKDDAPCLAGFDTSA